MKKTCLWPILKKKHCHLQTKGIGRHVSANPFSLSVYGDFLKCHSAVEIPQ